MFSKKTMYVVLKCFIKEIYRSVTEISAQTFNINSAYKHTIAGQNKPTVE